MRYRDALIPLGAVLLSSALLAGCGGQPQSAPDTGTPMPASSSSADASPNPSSPAGGQAESPRTGPRSGDEPSAAVPEILEFTGTTLDGDDFDGATLAGKPVVLWFWAPWCHICRGQIPTVTAVAERHDGRVNVVAVGGLDSEQAIKDLAADIGHVTHLVDEQGTVWQHFGVTAQSTFTVIAADGEVVSEGHLGDDEFATLVHDLAG